MSNPVAHHPVEGSLEVPEAPVDPAWVRLIMAERAIQEQARQMVNIQTLTFDCFVFYHSWHLRCIYKAL